MPGSKPDVFRLSPTATLRDNIRESLKRDSNPREISLPAYKAGAIDHYAIQAGARIAGQFMSNRLQTSVRRGSSHFPAAMPVTLFQSLA